MKSITKNITHNTQRRVLESKRSPAKYKSQATQPCCSVIYPPFMWRWSTGNLTHTDGKLKELTFPHIICIIERSASYSSIGNELHRIPDMLDFEGTEKQGNRILNFLRNICINCRLLPVCSQTKEIYVSLCVTHLLQTVDGLNCVTFGSYMTSVKPYTRRQYWWCVSSAPVVHQTRNCRKCIVNTFKRYLINCSPGVRQIWGLKELIS
jgi:hypothetical protein